MWKVEQSDEGARGLITPASTSYARFRETLAASTQYGYVGLYQPASRCCRRVMVWSDDPVWR